MKIDYNGEQVEAVNEEFTVSNEPTVTYYLENGTRIRVRHTMLHVLLVPGKFDNFGQPAYALVENRTSAVIAEPPALEAVPGKKH